MIGSLNKVVMGLHVLPVAKNSIWAVAFGLNRNSLIGYHRTMGNLFLLLIITHAVLMHSAASAEGESPVSAFPDNYTVVLSADRIPSSTSPPLRPHPSLLDPQLTSPFLTTLLYHASLCDNVHVCSRFR